MAWHSSERGFKANRGSASRLGTKRSGMVAKANTWSVTVEVELRTQHLGHESECNTVVVTAKPWAREAPTLTLFAGTEGELLRRIEGGA